MLNVERRKNDTFNELFYSCGGHQVRFLLNEHFIHTPTSMVCHISHDRNVLNVYKTFFLKCWLQLKHNFEFMVRKLVYCDCGRAL